MRQGRRRVAAFVAAAATVTGVLTALAAPVATAEGCGGLIGSGTRTCGNSATTSALATVMQDCSTGMIGSGTRTCDTSGATSVRTAAAA